MLKESNHAKHQTAVMLINPNLVMLNLIQHPFIQQGVLCVMIDSVSNLREPDEQKWFCACSWIDSVLEHFNDGFEEVARNDIDRERMLKKLDKNQI